MDGGGQPEQGRALPPSATTCTSSPKSLTASLDDIIREVRSEDELQHAAPTTSAPKRAAGGYGIDNPPLVACRFRVVTPVA